MSPFIITVMIINTVIAPDSDNLEPMFFTILELVVMIPAAEFSV